MDLVVDANILFSAAIKDGLTRKLLLIGKLHLYAPEFLLDETLKYTDYIAKKTSNKSEEVEKVIRGLFEAAEIVVFATPELHQFMPKAKALTPDPNDKDYFALALKLGCPIWSNDKKLRTQSRVRVYSTEELVGLI